MIDVDFRHLDRATVEELATLTCHWDEIYRALEFVKLDHFNTPLYRVKGLQKPPCGAKKALIQAYEHFGGRCYLCEKVIKDDATIDHIKTQSIGGKHNLLNLALAHRRCNVDKGAADLLDLRPVLAYRMMANLHAQLGDQMAQLALRSFAPLNPPSRRQPAPAATADP